MREKFVAEVGRFWRKRYYKDVGLPYSSMQLWDVRKADGTPVVVTCNLKYSALIHKFSFRPGNVIEFIAELDENALSDGFFFIFKRPGNYKIKEN